jgi:hypothetical protein
MKQRSRPMPRSPFRSPLPVPGKAVRLHASAPVKAAAVARRDTIPPKARALVNERDPWCVRCGQPTGLHVHHRRLKGQGGDSRAHADDCCNLIRLCSDCHYAVHNDDRRRAEAEGYIVPAETLLPGSVSVLVATADGGLEKYPSCDGRWLDEPLAGVA